jgi:cellulose synthase/poly-beta-1,6-N-acetylglucosamine synthase-like glycosyltransferase
MKWVFWSGAGLILYTYLGYPAWLWVRSRLHSRPVQRSAATPAVSIVMVVRNEAETLPAKLKNFAELDYPAEKLEIVIVSDGSTDGTEKILVAHAGLRFQVVVNRVGRGKAGGLNDALQKATGEIVVFTDARQSIERGALLRLVEYFGDPEVGCVSGELMLGDRQSGEAGKGMGMYWLIEKKIRQMEAASGSVVGATGALYAARRSLLVPLPPGLILDDVYLPMQVARQGRRVVFAEEARAWDQPDLGGRREFGRKVRTLSGNYQLLQMAPWLLSGRNPLRFEFFSHKLLRLLVPFALAAALLGSAFAAGAFYRALFALQAGFYALSTLTLLHLNRGPLARVADAAYTFVVLNTAAAVAFVNFVTGRKAVWLR